MLGEGGVNEPMLKPQKAQLDRKDLGRKSLDLRGPWKSTQGFNESENNDYLEYCRLFHVWEVF